MTNVKQEARTAEMTVQNIISLLRNSELFDSAQLLVTFVDSNGETIHFKNGFGNWYARKGMAHDFVVWDDARNACQVKKEEYST